MDTHRVVTDPFTSGNVSAGVRGGLWKGTPESETSPSHLLMEVRLEKSDVGVCKNLIEAVKTTNF